MTTQRDIPRRVGKFRNPGSSGLACGTTLYFRNVLAAVVGGLFADWWTEHHVFRVSALWIVLTLAVGPNAALLCRAWCHRQAVTPSGCHHQMEASSPRVAADDCCATMVLSVATFSREDVQRGVSAPDAGHSALVPRYQLAQSTTNGRPGLEPGREWSLDHRPRAVALRI